MAAAKSKKPRKGSRAKHGTCIPEGDDLLPGVDTEVLWSVHAGMSCHKDVGKEFPILKAAIKWREGLNTSEIARRMTESRSTVRNRLIRLRDRGLDGLGQAGLRSQTDSGRRCLVVIGVWLSRSPQAYGFESALWQTSTMRKMMLSRLGVDVKPRTIRNTLHRMGLSMRMHRGVPSKSAGPEERKAFVTKTQERIDSLSKDGYTFFYEGEMTMRLAAARGWLPRGGREIVKATLYKRSLKAFGALGRRVPHLMPARSTRSSAFRIFLEALGQK